jgi:hypothetical protein
MLSLERQLLRYKSISSKSLRLHILSVCKVMKESVKCKLPNNFASVFDGWTKGTIHHIEVSASHFGRANHCGTAATCADGE